MKDKKIQQFRIPGSLKHLFLAAEVSPKERALKLRKMQDSTDEKILERARQLAGLINARLGRYMGGDAYDV